ncbi:amidohydrolase family protein [Robertkochia sediminum]|uniref:amidohydrolase family protein n=1 Tax=Robertkochia sediminum TaxID=2785326 RepID=UPI001F33BCE7|nr:amidohydrolase family protein [Robertkochia sediminum]
MKRRLSIIGVVMFTALVACNSKNAEKSAQEPEAVIYHNGDILTMEGPTPVYAEALVEREGKIAFVGSAEEAKANFGSHAQWVDLDGKTLLPGFIDGHGHMYNTGLLSQAANVLSPPDGAGGSFDELVNAVKAWADSDDGKFLVGKMGWIIANGYDDSQLQEKQHPTKDVLDRISTEVPVVVIHQSGHLACVNTKALEVVGYSKATGEIEGGVMRRDSNGEPNGVLEEAAFFNALLPIIMEKTDAELQQKSVQRGQEQYAGYGYTTAQDGRSTADVTSAFEKAAAGNQFFIDVVAYPDLIWNKEAVTPDFYKPDRSYTNHYRIGGVKLTLDGSPQGKTAWLSKCYHVNPEGKEGCYTGYPILPDEKAIEYVTTAFENQWQILAHTNGDAAIDQLIKAVDAAQSTHGYPDHRTVMIHGQTLRKDQIPDLVRLEILPSLFPMHTFYWGDWHRESVLGEERAAYISPSRDVVDAGMTMTSHHDAPVTFPNSLRVLDATVNRVTRSGFILGPDQRLTPYEGLKSLTEWSAIQHFEEDSKGTLTEGKLADLVILNRNPLKVDPMKINEIKVLETIKEGKTVYKNENALGGWNTTKVEGDVKEALDYALGAVRPNAELREVLRAKKQVVRGLNYDLVFILENGETWNVTVYRDLDGNLSVTKKSKTPVPGGWSATEITPEVEEAVDFVLSRMNNASPLKEILSAERQVVKGMNYLVTFALENNSEWTARVHRDLDGSFTMLEQAKQRQ